MRSPAALGLVLGPWRQDQGSGSQDPQIGASPRTCTRFSSSAFFPCMGSLSPAHSPSENSASGTTVPRSGAHPDPGPGRPPGRLCGSPARSASQPLGSPPPLTQSAVPSPSASAGSSRRPRGGWRGRDWRRTGGANPSCEGSMPLAPRRLRPEQPAHTDPRVGAETRDPRTAIGVGRAATRDRGPAAPATVTVESRWEPAVPPEGPPVRNETCSHSSVCTRVQAALSITAPRGSDPTVR